jgi:predicted RNA-binding Zn-ribbon protein involved in translation (DUF1610 family)
MPRTSEQLLKELNEKAGEQGATSLIKKGKKVLFNCKCGKDGHKWVMHIILHGSKFLCPECTEIHRRNRLSEIHNTAECKEKIKTTCFEKYGTENPSLNTEIKEKIGNKVRSKEAREKYKQTSIKNYGTEHPMFNLQVKEIMREKISSKEVQDKIIATSLERFGAERNTKTSAFREQYTATCIERFGVRSPVQNADIFDKMMKTTHRYKDFITPSGQIIQCQGYEHFALETLFYMYDEGDIKTGRAVPEIWYKLNRKRRRYFCDIYIPSENLIIEVKSGYTFNKEKTMNIAKQNACITAGFNFEFWIFNEKGELTYNGNMV